MFMPQLIRGMFLLQRRSFARIFFALLVRGLLLFTLTQTCFTPAFADSASVTCFTEQLLAVTVDQQDLQQVATFLQAPNGDLLASEVDLQQWRFVLPTAKPITYQGQAYYFLADFPGLRYRVDYKRMAIQIMAPPTLLKEQDLVAAPSQFVTPTPSCPGAFLNYDTLAQSGGPGGQQLNALLTVGVFNRFGVTTSGFLAQRNTNFFAANNTVITSQNNANEFVRLNTVWEKDDPEHMRALRVGDSYSTPGLWGRSVDFGGIQWGTDFATQPAYITFPLPSASGQAVVPTVADLYVNNALVEQKNLPAGPFSINAIPVITGAGTVNVVTTDLLGRQQVVNLPYYASTNLLKAGLHDYSLEAGFIRNNYGLQSNDYSKFMIVGTDRLGVTNNFTGEWHTELLRSQQTVGIGGSYLLSTLGVLNLAVAASHDQGMGGLVSAGFQRQAVCGLNYGANVQLTSSQFAQIGYQSNYPAPALQEQAFIGAGLWDGASAAATYIQQNNRNVSNVSLVSVSYNQTIDKNWNLNLAGQTNVHGQNNKAVFLTLSRPVGERTMASVGGSAQKNNNQATAQVTRNLPIGPGWGYNLIASPGQNANYQATVSAQNDIGTYSAGAAQQQGLRGYQLQASGALAYIGGRPYLTRQLGDSFAVVQIPGYSNVRVYSNNQVIGRTDSHGNVFIPQLLPYQHNPIRIETKDLPLDAQINTDDLDAIPYYESGLVLQPAVKPADGAMVKLVLPSGEAVPSGALATLAGQTGQMPVADDGEAYVTGLVPGDNPIQVFWDDHRCSATIHYQPCNDPIPDLGSVMCE